MIYRFLLSILLLFVTFSYIVTDGFSHPGSDRDRSRGSSSWDTGNAVWEMVNDSSSDHPTITAYASANVTRFKREDANGSGSGDEYDEWGFGHASVSASTVTITINGNSDTHEPDGKVYHTAYVYFNDYSQRIWIKGDNNVSYTDYTGEYSESTSAYNSVPHPQTDRYLSGGGNGRISNLAEELLGGEGIWGDETTASAHASAP